jgi:lysozyme
VKGGGTPVVQGIDVSNNNGPVNWAAWNGRIGFAACKATEGDGYTDPDFTANWAGMLHLHRCMPRFAYSFFHAAQDPAVQAAHLVATVKGCGLLPGDNFILDVEETEPGANDGLTPAKCAPLAVECLRKINEYAPGHRVLPYMNPSWARAGGSAGMGSWFPWIADYGVNQPDVPPPWTTWTFWQYTDEPVDGDRFNGTETGLLEFCRMPPSR